ncbi:hypothetical protein [Pararhodobacter sp.]
MPIERRVLTTEPAPIPLDRRALCLDCPQCAGLCWSLAELERLPETILNSQRTARP